jgi:hypothetical protein
MVKLFLKGGFMKLRKFFWFIFFGLTEFFISPAFALTLGEKVKYIRFLMGSKIELTPREREKYAKAFLESTSGITLIISFYIQNLFERRFYDM